MSPNTYTDVKTEIHGKIGVITLNRPKQLNSFGGNLLTDLVGALWELDEHPETVFTVITGAGRFFSSGADINSGLAESVSDSSSDNVTRHGLKIAALRRFVPAMEVVRSMIDHKKVLVIAMNGPGVGAGATWFQSFSDLVYASSSTFFEIPFSALGLVPEAGSAPGFAQHIGVLRANELLMFGKRISARELVDYGLVNQIFPEGDQFLPAVLKHLQAALDDNDGKSMIEVKRLQNAGRREGRVVAYVNAFDALTTRIMEGAPTERFLKKREELERKKKEKVSSKL